ncbi:MAG: NAD(+)/NADH kinase [Clostridioides sp.]|jgi:NAD+ kinase|nr:NAD(+)/NADH kinase [Clostridioides sp.]
MKRTITINSNELEQSIETKNILKDKFIQNGFDVSDDITPDTELIVSIGGDGSFLKTARDFNFVDIPIVGINTGHLGFFAEISPHMIDEFIDIYINGDFVKEDISLLHAIIKTRDSVYTKLAVNEVVVKSDKSRVIHLALQFDDRLIQNFSGDGMLICTSTGSTAYNYSAGGSIVDTSLDVIQVTPLQPINNNAYRCFTSSIVAASDSIINISPEQTYEDSTLIVVDGIEYRFIGVEKIELSLHPKKISLIRMLDYEFWKMVAEKFL